MVEKVARIEKKLDAEEKELKKEEKELQKLEQKVEKIEEKMGGEKEAKIKALVQRDLLTQSSISIHVDDYGFLFSDFDPRPFSQRVLSEDFLREAKRFALEAKEGQLELIFLIPQSARKPETEVVVKKRLREHFKKQHQLLLALKNKATMNGILLCVSGFVMMIAATLVASLEKKDFLALLAFVILEPAGWFSLWYGLDTIFYFAKEKDSELEFYEKMSKAEITFNSY